MERALSGVEMPPTNNQTFLRERIDAAWRDAVQARCLKLNNLCNGEASDQNNN